MEEKERILAKHKKPEPEPEEEEKPKDSVVTIREGTGCKTEFVVVESVHYALVRKLAFKFLPSLLLFPIPRKQRRNASLRMLLIAVRNLTNTVRTWSGMFAGTVWVKSVEINSMRNVQQSSNKRSQIRK